MMDTPMYDIEVRRDRYERVPYRGLYIDDRVRIKYHMYDGREVYQTQKMGIDMAKRIMYPFRPMAEDAKWHEARIESIIADEETGWITIKTFEPYID